MAKIGRIGGTAGKGSAAKLASAKKAAAVRWGRATMKPVNIEVVGRLFVDDFPPELHDELTGTRNVVVGADLHQVPVSHCTIEGKCMMTGPGFLPRITEFLSRVGRLPVVRFSRLLPVPDRHQRVMRGLPRDLQVRLRRALNFPTGAVLRGLSDSEAVSVITSIQRAFEPRAGVVVVEHTERAHRLYEHLLTQQVKVGIHAGERRDMDRLMIVTRPMQRDEGFKALCHRQEFAIAWGLPRTGHSWLEKFAEETMGAVKYGIMDQRRYREDQLMLFESIFGPIC